MRRVLVLALAGLLVGCGGNSTAKWVEVLRRGDPAQKLHAVRALESRGTEADLVVPALAEALRDENAFVRRDAAAALGKIGPDARAALPALLALRRDRERGVRQAVDRALKNIDPAEAGRAGGR
jgi:HEAT repeat protein